MVLGAAGILIKVSGLIFFDGSVFAVLFFSGTLAAGSFSAGGYNSAGAFSGVEGSALATRADSCAADFSVEGFFLGPGTSLGLTTFSSFSRTGTSFIPGSIIGILPGFFAGTVLWGTGGGTGLTGGAGAFATTGGESCLLLRPKGFASSRYARIEAGTTIRTTNRLTSLGLNLVEDLVLEPRFLRRFIPGLMLNDFSFTAFLRLSAIRLKGCPSQPAVDTDNSMGFRPENFKAFKLTFAELRSLNGPT